jgi:hypothetical protein
VRGFLYQALRNAILDMISGGPLETSLVLGGAEDGEIDATVELKRARKQLFERIVPAIQQRKSGRSAAEAALFVSVIRQLEAIRDGETSVSEIVDADPEAGTNRDSPSWKTVRNRYYRRVFYALQAIIEETFALWSRETPSDVAAAALRIEIERLRPQKGGQS